MILYKTYSVTGGLVSVMRDAVPGDSGYSSGIGPDGSAQDMQLVQDQTGHVFCAPKYTLSNASDQQWPVVPATSQSPEEWPANPEGPINV